MFKLVQSRLFFNASNLKYVVQNRKYLIQAPPKHPVTSYLLYNTQSTKGLKVNDIKQKSLQLAKQWKQNPSLRQKYQNIAKANAQEFLKQKRAYERKYPLKNVTLSTLVHAQYQNQQSYASNNTSGGKTLNIGKLASQRLKKVPEDKRLKLINEANKIRDENKEKVQKYLIPPHAKYSYKDLQRYQKKFFSQLDTKLFRVQNPLNNLWVEQVKQWLQRENYKITLQEFLQLYFKEQKKSRISPAKSSKSSLKNQANQTSQSVSQ